MRTADNLWDLCQSGEISRSEWDYQRKVVYKGVSYTDSEMKAISYRRSLVDDSFGLGKTIAAELNVSIVVGKAVKVRKNEEVEFYVRIKTKNNGDTPWYKFGKFYIQEASRQADVWTFICYDALILLQREKFTTDTATVSSALNMIASEIGVGIDSRTNIVNDITLDKLKKYTMIEVLGYIASLNYGNIYLTEENNLRLVVPNITGTARAVINDHNTKAISHGAIMDFNKVVLSVSKNSEDEEFVSGTGKNKLEVINPWGSQSLADNIHKIVSRFEMNPKDTSSSEVDIMLELGDLVVIDGDPIQIMSMDYSPRMYLSITSPSDTDKVSKTKSSPSKTNPDPTDPSDPELEEKEKEISDLEECHIIQESELQYYSSSNPKVFNNSSSGRNYKCLIIPKSIENLKIWTSTDALIKGGLGLTKTENMFGYSNNNGGTLDISELNTSNVEDFSFMFSGSYQPDFIGLNRLKSNNAKNLKSMFSQSNINEIILSGMSTNKATNFDYMFNRSEAKSIDISTFSSRSLTSNISEMFSNCKNLTRVKIGANFNLSEVKNMYQIFEGCTALKELDLSMFELTNLKQCTNLLAECVNLRKIEFPRMHKYYGRLDYYNYIEMSKTLYNCKKIKEVDLSSIEFFANEKIVFTMNKFFENCESLEEFTPPSVFFGEYSFDADMIYDWENQNHSEYQEPPELWIDNAFDNTPNLKYIDLSNFKIRTVYGNMSIFKNCGAEYIKINHKTENWVIEYLRSPIANPNNIPIILSQAHYEEHPNGYK